MSVKVSSARCSDTLSVRDTEAPRRLCCIEGEPASTLGRTVARLLRGASQSHQIRTQPSGFAGSISLLVGCKGPPVLAFGET